MPAMRRSAQPGVEKAGRVGEEVERRSRLVQALHQFAHLREGVVEHLVEPTVEGFDQGLLAGMVAHQATRRSGRISAAVLYLVPLPGRHGGQETLHFRRVRDELAVEVPGVPIEQHAAHVENRDRGARSA